MRQRVTQVKASSSQSYEFMTHRRRGRELRRRVRRAEGVQGASSCYAKVYTVGTAWYVAGWDVKPVDK